LILSFPNFNLWGFGWFGFVPLFFALEDKNSFQRFLIGYLTGIIFFCGVIWWLCHVSILGLVLLILYLAIYFGIFGLFIRSYLLSTTYSLFFIPSFWILLEYLRSHLFTGFGWALLGYSQYLNLTLIQISDITGIWGVSFFMMMTNTVIYELIKDFRLVFAVHRLPKSEVIATRYTLYAKRYLLVFILFIVIWGYGVFRLGQYTNDKPKLKVSVIQGNIPQEIKWEKEAGKFILDRYLDLTLKAAEDHPDLIIWPEAAYPKVLIYTDKKDRLIVEDFVEEKKIPLLLGVVIREDRRYFNSAVLIEPDKRAPQRYDKLHLVPFGEYIPLKKIFRFLETVYPIGDFTPGKDYTLFSLTSKELDVSESKFSVLICFEDIFPEISRRFVKKGADFLVVITNDAWFGKSSAPYQHLQASVFRAIENRRYLVRAANTGVSCFITPKGEIISKVSKNKEDIFISGYRTEEVLLKKRNLTLYTRFGDYFIPLCLIIFGCGIIRYRLYEI